MKDLATLFRSLQLYAHIEHNETQGQTFFSDHEFLGELYGTYEAAYDSLIERMIGLNLKPDLFSIQSEACALLQTMKGKDCFKTLLDGERKVQTEIEALISAGASQGTINLLADLADQSEARAYKLQQRNA